ncbi:hypothetical protein [Marivirga sp.]|uniref:hypothetical protein n=1 Tax=Marivirga sp. TaxID=2018662 RepID=UPI0025EB0B14|nr:hypothetical protein [Marivirga sp.]
METYKIMTICHVVFTIAAFVSGLVAIIVEPKGGEVHKKSGRYYFYFYVGVVLTAFLMLFIKFKIFFLALTLFGTYLIIAGTYYAKKNEKIITKNWWILSILLLTVFIYLVDVFIIIFNIELGWIIVRLTFAMIALSTLIFELSIKRNRILLHATLMLLSFIPLINGLMARLSPNEYVWIFWILGYIIFIPLIIAWFKQSKKLKALLK